MVSLTTVYIVSVLLGSIASIGSAFVGKRFIGGGNDSNIPNDINKLEEQPIPSAPLEEIPSKVEAPIPSAPLEEDNPSQVAGRLYSTQH